MAACGVPFVASPRPEYAELAAQGAGVLAGDGARECRREVQRLLANATLRDELAQRGREVVCAHWLLENNMLRTARACSSTLGRARAA
jgi:glycosyltransferase involved in cell wall biosynthesis